MIIIWNIWLYLVGCISPTFKSFFFFGLKSLFSLWAQTSLSGKTYGAVHYLHVSVSTTPHLHKNKLVCQQSCPWNYPHSYCFSLRSPVPTVRIYRLKWPATDSSFYMGLMERLASHFNMSATSRYRATRKNSHLSSMTGSAELFVMLWLDKDLPEW